VRIDIRYAPDDLDLVSRSAKELVGLKPDAILVDSTPWTAALQRETRAIPIIFVAVSDPIGSGFVASLSHPGGNLTGFSNQDPTLAGKWVELLTGIAPGRTRIAALFNPGTAPFTRSYYLPSFEAAARFFKVEPIVAPVHSDAEIGAVIASLGREPDPCLKTIFTLHVPLISTVGRIYSAAGKHDRGHRGAPMDAGIDHFLPAAEIC
jgi:putative ABC transport system substrate-binding protein